MAMRNSNPVSNMTVQFMAQGCRTIRFEETTEQAFIDTVLLADHPLPNTPAQVGGCVGSVTNNENGTMTYTIRNKAGANSFSYHLLPNSPLSFGPYRTIIQTFSWTDPLPATGCGR
jgi:hypothetical protein